MATKLNKLLKREIEVDGKLYTIALSPEGVKLTEKGKRLGSEHTWKALIGGASAGGGASGAGGTFGPGS